jgi:succinate dehydrogenase / fumarate reductase cytochrome b subunit
VAETLAASRTPSFVRSTIGQKVVMAVTGVILVGFLFAHMLGNLQMFLPDAEAINHYGRFLREALHGGGLWIARGVLLVSVVLHIAASWSLSRTSWKARPVAYKKVAHDASTYASRTMRWSGPIVLLFIVYHLLHFTVGSVHPAFVEGDVHRNVTVGFSDWRVSVFYIIAMLALGLHLRHGVWSMLQTLGASHPRWDGTRNAIATVFTVVVILGFISVPLAVMAGVLK